MSSILTHMLLPIISISIVTFKNIIVSIQLYNKSFRDMFSADLVLLNQISDSSIYTYETH